MGKIEIKPPFPYFGGKSTVADIVWERFGDTYNYIEPFAGSLAVLLNRSHWPWVDNRIETVNDKDCYIANFWRATKHDPEAVAEWCDWPVNEADLTARHTWLVDAGQKQIDKVKSDPDYYDAKVAGWWCWGLCQWIGSGWCLHPEWKQLPSLRNAGMGVHRPTQQLPSLGNAGRGVLRTNQNLIDYFNLLKDRLKSVRVTCGDWSRITKPALLSIGPTAVFLDPPYSKEAGRTEIIYSQEDLSVAHKCREWAIEHGTTVRIALCGLEPEHDLPEDWECIAWKSTGGIRRKEGGRGVKNSELERIWFSPHCLRPKAKRKGLLY